MKSKPFLRGFHTAYEEGSRVEEEEEEEDEDEELDSNSGAFSPEPDTHTEDSPSPTPTGSKASLRAGCVLGPEVSSSLSACVCMLEKKADDALLPHTLHQIAEALVLEKDYPRALRFLQLERLYHERVLSNITALQENWESRWREDGQFQSCSFSDLDLEHLEKLRHICRTHTQPWRSSERGALGKVQRNSVVSERRQQNQRASERLNTSAERLMEKREDDFSEVCRSSTLVPQGVTEASLDDSFLGPPPAQTTPPVSVTDSLSTPADEHTHTHTSKHTHTAGREEMEGGVESLDTGQDPDPERERMEEKRGGRGGGGEGEEEENRWRDEEEVKERREEKEEEKRSGTAKEQKLTLSVERRGEEEPEKRGREAEEEENKGREDEGGKKGVRKEEEDEVEEAVEALELDTEGEAHGRLDLEVPELRAEEDGRTVEDRKTVEDGRTGEELEDECSAGTPEKSDTLDDLAKRIQVEEITPAPELVSILKRRESLEATIATASAPKTPGKRRVRFSIPDHHELEHDEVGGDSWLLLLLLCLATVVISVGGTALYCTFGDAHSSVCTDFSQNMDFYLGQIQRGVDELRLWLTRGS
ncbi:consortin [Hoplias malabaricus]|uniref:consortin n=1 Tax=Hoplias malabaricus TaxID=27720 RepID=UPI0034631F7E